MRPRGAIMLGIGLILVAALSVVAPAKAQHDFPGLWAGERMLCDAPRNRLHVYGLKRIRHPDPQNAGRSSMDGRDQEGETWWRHSVR